MLLTLKVTEQCPSFYDTCIFQSLLHLTLDVLHIFIGETVYKCKHF